MFEANTLFSRLQDRCAVAYCCLTVNPVLLVPQRIDGIERGGLPGRVDTKHQTDGARAQKSGHDPQHTHLGAQEEVQDKRKQ